MGRCEHANLVTGFFVDAVQVGTNGSLPIGPGNVNEFEPVLRISQRDRQMLDIFEPKLCPEESEPIQVLQCFSIIHPLFG